MDVVPIKREPKSRQDFIKSLRDLLEMAYDNKIEYLELIYTVNGKQYNRHHIDYI